MRSLDRIVVSTKFSEALYFDPNNVEVHEALAYGNVVFIEKWIEQTLKKEIGELGIRELRDLAKNFGIIGYTTYSKDALLVEVLRVSKTKKVAS